MATDTGDTGNTGDTGDTTCNCPLCDHQCSHRNHLRDHLHEHHRKSEIIDVFLDQHAP
ncbi:hypothetical protein [Halogranum rubrum]|uniref:C2H2-type domain-containing protein n=1 Tax=Halogranum salarium B-1 TaxID=1210908 RepID=J2ZVK3_9EURY|nr:MULTISPECIES: hypothetical protein [Halogranum]EJN57058.1 hypothetical protein HSB1_44440 [Halogranum salarium B-1]